jgi:tetratricopeptide (TPR) repeat protein
MKSAYGLPWVLMGAAVVIMQPAYVLAQNDSSVSHIRNVASASTVFIQSVSRPNDIFGSGVLIRRSGNTYTVLTAKHIVAFSDDYTVTVNKTPYKVVSSQIKTVGNLDLAVLQFQSQQSLQLANLGSSVPKELDRVYVAGFPKPTASVPYPAYTIATGEVNTVLNPDEAREGYRLRYSVNSREGMSGGPVLNDQAQLVGIHGRADQVGGLAVPLQPYLAFVQQAEQQIAESGQAAQQKAEAERVAQQKAEADRLAQQKAQQKAEADRLAQQKAEADRSAQQKAEADRLAQQKAEADRSAQQKAQQKAEAERLAQQKAEADRIAQQKAQTTPPPTGSAGVGKLSLAGIEPFAAPRSVPSAPSGGEEKCEMVSFGGTKIRRCSAAGGSSSSSSQSAQNFEDYLRSGNEQAARGRVESAIAEYTQAISAKPDYGYAYFNRGLYLAKSGRLDQALEDFAQAETLFKQQGMSAELGKVQGIIMKIKQSRGVS